ncbi:hypothetical protein EDC04DRAFT_2606465 [Pisolithus marmoratus]|nr:hypothetical protein EDC04DRAFT_2606465 [Pisolithus marmoratus]
MWSEPLLQELQQLGICAPDMQTSLPYFNNFHELLLIWPGAPLHLWVPVELDEGTRGKKKTAQVIGRAEKVALNLNYWDEHTGCWFFPCFHIFSSIVMRLQLFIIAPSSTQYLDGCLLPQTSKSSLCQLPTPAVDTSVNDCLPSTPHHPASQLVDTAENNYLQVSCTIQHLVLQVVDGASQTQPGSFSNASVSATWPLFVPPPLAHHHHPPGMKALYLPIPPPIFVLLGHQHFAQDPQALPNQPQQQSHQEIDIFDTVNELHIE